MLVVQKSFYSGLVWITLDYSGLLWIAKAGDGKLLIKLVKSTRVADKVCEEVWGPHPLGAVRRNNVTKPGNIEDYRCPRRNIAP